MKSIYAVQSNTQKSNLYTAYSHFFKVPSTVTTIDKSAHAFKRRINVRALTPTSIKELEGSIYKNCSIFLDMLVDENESSGWSQARNMTNLVAYLTSDIMGDVAFSRNWDLMRGEENRHMIDILHLGTGLINTVCFSYHNSTDLMVYLQECFSQDTCLLS
jgi:cytochrome P450